MATGDSAAAAGEGDSSNSGSKQQAAAVSSSSSTVSTSSSAAAAAVSEASSSMSLPSLPSLSDVTGSTSASLAASFAHVTTLCPLSTAAAAASAAAVAAADYSVHGGGGLVVVVARPAAVVLHDVFTMEATSTSDMADDTSAAGSVKCVAHLHGGKAAVTGHQDGRLRLWRMSSRAPDRLRLAAALPTVSDRLRRFPVPSNHVTVRRHHRRLWIEHADAVSGVAASADGRLLFSVSWDKTLKVWAVPSLRCLQSLPAHDDAVNAVAVAHDGTVYTASADRRVRVWAPGAGGRARQGLAPPGKKPAYHLVATLSRHAAAVNAVAVGCGGQVLYSGGNDRCVVVWERRTARATWSRSARCAGTAGRCSPSRARPGTPPTARWWSAGGGQTVCAWRRGADGRGYYCVAVIDGHGSAVRSVAAALVTAQKKRRADDDGGDEEWRVCSASFDGEVRLWSLRVAAAS